MKAMILAAGEGRRMRPLTLHRPKPLIPVAGKALIHHHLEKLAGAGFSEVVINACYRADQLMSALGDGAQWGLQIHYSLETQALETAGGIAQALPLLGDNPFLLINGDVWTDMDFSALKTQSLDGRLGHLLLISNPEHNLNGDFKLTNLSNVTAQTAIADRVKTGLVSKGQGVLPYTYTGVSVLHPDLILAYPQRRQTFPLAECFDWALRQRALSGELYSGQWVDVGTPERLQQVNAIAGCGFSD